ncbi:hypothetical protein Taro_053202 [Colocasia esculenta]|uniref:Uncharacterized protein n=1 Tax=Colocasia esculenta TaxID=4460 RepID=A0A843XLH6_COLES|nr:hypothetical protein [Colocasia esculenta]
MLGLSPSEGDRMATRQVSTTDMINVTGQVTRSWCQGCKGDAWHFRWSGLRTAHSSPSFGCSSPSLSPCCLCSVESLEERSLWMACEGHSWLVDGVSMGIGGRKRVACVREGPIGVDLRLEVRLHSSTLRGGLRSRGHSRRRLPGRGRLVATVGGDERALKVVVEGLKRKKRKGAVERWKWGGC